MDDRAELTDHTEAWPEDPELVEETEMRGRWLGYGIDGEMKAEASDFTMPPAEDTRETWACVGVADMELGACGSTAAAAQALDTSSANDEGSVLIIAIEGGAPCPGDVELPMPELGEVAADEADRDAMGELWTAEETDGGAMWFCEVAEWREGVRAEA